MPAIVYETLRSSGQPLDAGIRRDMERRIAGADFGKVHIHTDPRASSSAEAVNARAYAVGQHIVFGEQQFRPETRSGKELLAHELVHTLQQPAGFTDALAIAPSSDASEQEAHQLAARAVSGIPSCDKAAPSGVSGQAVQRVAGVDDAAELGVLLWCVSGALTTVAIDEVLQGARWLSKGGRFKQNWCKTLFSALYGCIFGMAGGAFAAMFEAELAALGLRITTSTMLQWLIKKASVSFFNQLAGKMTLLLAKAGCDQVEQQAALEPEDSTDQSADRELPEAEA